MIREDIATLLKQKRLDKGLTLDEAAKIIGVSKTTYRDYENGVLLIKNMKIDKLIPLSLFLEVLPNQLFNLNSNEFTCNLNKAQFREYVTKILKHGVYDLDSNDKEYLIKSIDLICR